MKYSSISDSPPSGQLFIVCTVVMKGTRFRLGTGCNQGSYKKKKSLCKGFSGLTELLTGTVKCDGDVIDKIWPYLSELKCILFQGRLILTPVSLLLWKYQENWEKSYEKLHCWYFIFQFWEQKFGLLCSDVELLLWITEVSSVVRVLKVTRSPHPPTSEWPCDNFISFTYCTR